MPMVSAAAASPAAIFPVDIFFADQPLVLRPAGDCAVGTMLCKRLAPLAVGTEGIPGGAAWDRVCHLREAVNGEVAATAATAARIAFLMLSLPFVVRGTRAGGRAFAVVWWQRAGRCQR
jgi:hypothetical protein